MSTLLDIVNAVRDLLEPDEPGRPVIDETGEQPFTWSEDTLYVYPIANAETPIETGPVVRQDFGLLAVYVAGSHEEPAMERQASVSELLDGKRARYMDAVRANQVTETWHHSRASERPNPPRTLQSRAVAIEIRGFRVVS
jgi:hypothetical protein